MEKAIKELFEKWHKRNISATYLADKAEVNKKVIEMIPASATIGISGSVTLDGLGTVKVLEDSGRQVFNQYKPGISREDSLKLRKLGSEADYFLTSANAISMNGEMVFFSAYGHRTAGISYAKNVIVIAGINKIVPDLEKAIKRAREYVTPLNCKRLGFKTPCFEDSVCRNDECTFPEFNRMCCQILIIEAEISSGRLNVILVGEDLGF